ncbi:MAG: cytochrome C biogenesis protein [Actinobacteria bacterium]|nr:MAG: cytochrome C biogenesis protein [Actinomycetota bacterium]
MSLELAAFWLGMVLYLSAALLALASLLGSSQKLVAMGVWLAAAGVGVHLLATAVRWIDVGHGPYITRYEGMSSNALAIAALFLLVQWRFPKVRSIAPYVLAAIVIVMGVAASSPKTADALPLTFQSHWLVVHIWFAKLANGALLLGAACAGGYLLKRRRLVGGREEDGGFAEIEWLDEFSYKLTAFGFIFLALMIGAGSIWANKSWGSYWSWDAIETWSLVTWIVYGIYLHLRRTFGWKGERAAYLLLAALVVAIASFFFIGLIFTGLHREFLGVT